MKTFEILHAELGLDYPNLFQSFVAMQSETGYTIVHDNYIGEYFLKFIFLDFTKPDLEKYKDGAVLYEGNLFDPCNVYFQTKHFLAEEARNIKLLENEELLPIAKDFDGDGCVFLYLSNRRDGVFLINLGWCDSPLVETAPTLATFLPTESQTFKLQADTNYHLIANWTTIFDYYKQREYEKYGEVYITDPESFDDLNCYKRFFEELFEKLAYNSLKLEGFHVKAQSPIIEIIVNSQNFELEISQDRDWFDEGLIDEMNNKLESLLGPKKFELVKDSKFTGSLRIALV